MIEENLNNQARKPRLLVFGSGLVCLFLALAILFPSSIRLRYGMAIVFIPSLLGLIFYFFLGKNLTLRYSLGLILASCYALVHWASNDRLLIFVSLGWLFLVWADKWRRE